MAQAHSFGPLGHAAEFGRSLAERGELSASLPTLQPQKPLDSLGCLGEVFYMPMSTLSYSGRFKRILNMGLLDMARMVRDPGLERIRSRPPRNHSVEEAVRFLLPEAPAAAELTTLLREIQLDHTFHDEVNERFVNTRGRRVTLERWTEFLYVVVRVMRPQRRVSR